MCLWFSNQDHWILFRCLLFTYYLQLLPFPDILQTGITKQINLEARGKNIKDCIKSFMRSYFILKEIHTWIQDSWKRLKVLKYFFLKHYIILSGSVRTKSHNLYVKQCKSYPAFGCNVNGKLGKTKKSLPVHFSLLFEYISKRKITATNTTTSATIARNGLSGTMSDRTLSFIFPLLFPSSKAASHQYTPSSLLVSFSIFSWVTLGNTLSITYLSNSKESLMAIWKEKIRSRINTMRKCLIKLLVTVLV